MGNIVQIHTFESSHLQPQTHSNSVADVERWAELVAVTKAEEKPKLQQRLFINTASFNKRQSFIRTCINSINTFQRVQGPMTTWNTSIFIILFNQQQKQHQQRKATARLVTRI
jgi:hypothetical protein